MFAIFAVAVVVLWDGTEWGHAAHHIPILALRYHQRLGHGLRRCLTNSDTALELGRAQLHDLHHWRHPCGRLRLDAAQVWSSMSSARPRARSQRPNPGRPFRLLALNGGSTMSAPTSARGRKAEMLQTAPIRGA